MRSEQQAHAACHLMLREKDRKLREWQFRFETLKSLYDEVLKTLLTQMNGPGVQPSPAQGGSHKAALQYLAEELRRIAVPPQDIERVRRGLQQRLGERQAASEADDRSKRWPGSSTAGESGGSGEKRRVAGDLQRSAVGLQQRRLQSSNDTDASELQRRDANLHRSESSLFGLNSLPAEYLSAAETVSLHLPAYSQLLRLGRPQGRQPKKGPAGRPGERSEEGSSPRPQK